MTCTTAIVHLDGVVTAYGVDHDWAHRRVALSGPTHRTSFITSLDELRGIVSPTTRYVLTWLEGNAAKMGSRDITAGDFWGRAQ